MIDSRRCLVNSIFLAALLNSETQKAMRMPTGWIEQPTSSLRVTRSTTELNGQCLHSLVDSSSTDSQTEFQIPAAGPVLTLGAPPQLN
jgi:hypothetical protein